MREMGKEKDIGEATYKKELTMVIDVEGPEKVTITNLLKTIRMLCGGILGCRPLGLTSYEITLSNEVARDKLMDGFKMGATVVTGRKLVWPGITIVDGTRFVRVRFTDAVQSLPYSTKFNSQWTSFF